MQLICPGPPCPAAASSLPSRTLRWRSGSAIFRSAVIRGTRSGTHRDRRRQRYRKSTLLRLITGELEAERGEIHRLTDRMAVLDQHVRLLDPGNESILENLRRLNPDLSDNETHAALARFAFRNKAALQIAGTLSGGERLRAGWPLRVRTKRLPRLLLMDEPTNHLDLASIEELKRMYAITTAH